ncbi:phosphoribulokinase [Serratia ureilytica]|nr:phosphoribulokinase [Serratia ureilytica]
MASTIAIGSNSGTLLAMELIMAPLVQRLLEGKKIE